MKYPISEMFLSPQGEGLFTGTLMWFIRFAGCSVGKKIRDAEYEAWQKSSPNFSGTADRELKIYTEKCCTFDGREFLCDTDFRTKEVLTVEEIIGRIPRDVFHICLTGGEPLIHNLLPLIDELKVFFWDCRKKQMPCIHIETSGTIMVPDELDLEEGYVWLTVSPKFGVLDDMVDLADEIKILVDENFDEGKLPASVLEKETLWIQPINFEFSVDDANLLRVLELQKKHPSWRISTQMHKVWRVR